MRKGFLGSLVLLAAVAGTALGQQEEEDAVPPPPAEQCGTPEGCEDTGCCCRPGRARDDDASWVQADYLLWRVKDGPLPVPLLTRGGSFDLTSPTGFIGTPGSRVLLGNSDLDYGTFSGLRLSGGRWLDDDHDVGWEVGGFLLESRSDGDLVSSATPGNGTLSRPFVDATTGQAAAVLVATPGLVSGTVSVLSRCRLFGAESNLRLQLVGEKDFCLDTLVGFRFAELDEELEVDEQTTVLGTAGPVGGDRFFARNEFFGGQVGASAECRRGNLFVDVLGKLALGDSHEWVDETGLAFLVEPTNHGRHTRDQFAVLPEAELRLGYQLTRCLRAYVAYDILYWSRVARPGDQIDLTINPSQLNGGTLSGPARPAFTGSSTDFWAQGVNFGLEMRF